MRSDPALRPNKNQTFLGFFGAVLLAIFAGSYLLVDDLYSIPGTPSAVIVTVLAGAALPALAAGALGRIRLDRVYLARAATAVALVGAVTAVCWLLLGGLAAPRRVDGLSLWLLLGGPGVVLLSTLVTVAHDCARARQVRLATTRTHPVGGPA